MYGYPCECGKGTVQTKVLEIHEVVINKIPFTIKDAQLGVCDHCGETIISVLERKRWLKLYQKKYPPPKPDIEKIKAMNKQRWKDEQARRKEL